jgi:4'-phosphopantetheinyl transferase
MWTASRIPGTFAAEEIHLWAWPLLFDGQDMSAHREILDGRERERMQRFHFAADADRYAIVHANVRRILAPYINQPAEKIAFRTGPFGKPELAGDTSLKFSLSHSHTTALLAVDPELPLGVDVEDLKPIEPEVADKHFSATELSMLRGLQGDEWLTGFYRCWTRKEAILKAEGVGLSRDLDSFDISLLPDQKAELVSTRQHFSNWWALHDVSLSPHIIAALAAARSQAQIVRFHL